MVNFLTTATPTKGPLAERLSNYFANVPEASREQFLVDALQKEIGRREQQFNGGRPWPAPKTRRFRPAPPPTLPSEVVHDWLCQRLEVMDQTRRRRRGRRSWWLW